ncbi:HrpE/YscL family type III secretion apparatus protein [Alcaligenes endophyticus]|uniref:Type 3 secretion system stator protein n=1 Tax=Alcaligenes endophyticus TaxID=1929088 RepID=A0ABT8EFK3_9BURK|nr:HrpE/YscL family type III secretion apparatus protein [Alcaligenes endophyticus]MCX5590276.1 HrpE/YscL family type III secretion apparatus protein [Alcaligenes endophyticus]MDN4120060.1 HrpE/YscL family type III secretion apparatus protein [Alcaligenes endophyticus]
MSFLYPRNALQPETLSRRCPSESKIIRREDYAAWCDAQELLTLSQQEADEIRAQAVQVYEQEKQRGYEDGSLEARLQQSEKIIETVGRTVDYLANFEQEIVTLVMSSVEKIINDFDDEEKVMAVTRNALTAVRNQKQLVLRLHPTQTKLVSQRMDELLAAFPIVGYIDVTPDSRVAPNACIIESEIGMIEADLHAQLGALRSAFERILGSRV